MHIPSSRSSKEADPPARGPRWCSFRTSGSFPPVGKSHRPPRATPALRGRGAFAEARARVPGHLGRVRAPARGRCSAPAVWTPAAESWRPAALRTQPRARAFHDGTPTFRRAAPHRHGGHPGGVPWCPAFRGAAWWPRLRLAPGVGGAAGRVRRSIPGDRGTHDVVFHLGQWRPTSLRFGGWLASDRDDGRGCCDDVLCSRHAMRLACCEGIVWVMDVGAPGFTVVPSPGCVAPM